MYNGAGQFAKEIGLPCKSGVAGGLLVVIPGIGSIGCFGPKLNKEGNSSKGIHMLKLLSCRYSNFNLFIKD
jgi:glutaminase